MIDFRYHLVSLIAVFLALALGILVGTTELNGAVLDNLNGQVNSLKTDKRDLQAESRNLRGQLGSNGEFTRATAPLIVADLLADDRVVVVSTPGVTGDIKEDMTEVLRDAGATVTGRIALTEDYADPRRADAVRQLVDEGGAPDGFHPPADDGTGILAGALLSSVLLGQPDDSEPDPDPGSGSDSSSESDPVTDDKNDNGSDDESSDGADASQLDLSEVLAGLSGLNLLRLETNEVTPADYAVLLTTGEETGEDAGERVRALANLAGAMRDAGRGVVVAGDIGSAGEHGLVGGVRGDEDLAGRVSTVDNADQPIGQIIGAFALCEQGEGVVGQYGLADNADKPFPEMTK